MDVEKDKKCELSMVLVDRLIQEWSADKNQSMTTISRALVFDYSKTKSLARKRNQIVPALALWSFVQDSLGSYSWETTRAFLAKFLRDENRMVRVVAMIEMLPTSVWRELLWEGNIDFMSAESFLRRLSTDQSILIQETYEALIRRKILPDWMARQQRFQKTSVETLFNESIRFKERYKNQAAMAADLGGQGMGFNKYDDYTLQTDKVSQRNDWRKFFRKKEAGNFVINPYGRYGHMFRTARSNYVFRPGAEIQFPNHVCPAFWFTWIIHFIFWIGSPLAFGEITADWAIDGLPFSWMNLSLVMIGMVTPMWLLAAGVRYTFERFYPKEQVSGWFDKHSYAIEGWALGIFCSSLAVYYIVMSIRGLLLFSQLHGWWVAIWLIGLVHLYIDTKIAIAIRLALKGTGKQFPCWAEHPRVIRYLTVILTLGAYIGAGYIFQVELLFVLKTIGQVLWAIAYIVYLGLSLIWDVIIFLSRLFGIFAFLLLVPIVGLFLIRRLKEVLSEEIQEKAYLWSEKYMGHFSAGFGIAILIWVGYVVVKGWMNSQLNLWQMLGIMGYLFVCSGCMFVLFRKLVQFDPKFGIMYAASYYAYRSTGKKQPMSYRYIQRNRWLRSMDEKELIGVIKKIHSLVIYLFQPDEQRDEMQEALVEKANRSILDTLDYNKDFLIDFDLRMRRLVFQNVLRGRTFKVAWQQAEARLARRRWVDSGMRSLETVWEQIYPVVKWLTCPIWGPLLVLKFLARAIVALVIFIGTSYKRCPLMVHEETIIINPERLCNQYSR